LGENKIELKSAIKDGVPFWFGDIKFIPRNNGTANAIIAKTEDEA
jgi:hypothetical protein